MDEYNSIEDYIRDDKFSKISPDAKSYKVQIKRQSSPSNDEKEPEKKQQQEKPKNGQGDVVNGPDMTCKSTKNRPPRKKGRLPSEVGNLCPLKSYKRFNDLRKNRFLMVFFKTLFRLNT